jgi:hypothetical protein
MEDVVHLSDWAAQGDIHIACTGQWTEPAWGGKAKTDTPNVFRTTEGTYYTFTTPLVTCPLCQTRVPVSSSSATKSSSL